MARSKMDSKFNANARNQPSLPPPEPDYCDRDRDNWTCEMRRLMQEIVPGVFLGSLASASKSNLENMKAAGLTHVVCVRSSAEENVIRVNHADHFQYLILEMEESQYLQKNDSIVQKVKTLSTFIDNCLGSGGKVLIYGMTGMFRSATLMIGFIMSKYRVNYQIAAHYVRCKRFCVLVGIDLHQQLIENESTLMNMYPGIGLEGNKENESENYRSTKRKIEEVEMDVSESRRDNVRRKMDYGNDDMAMDMND